jgi:MFS superfamily sulfate permease-like transporter
MDDREDRRGVGVMLFGPVRGVLLGLVLSLALLMSRGVSTSNVRRSIIPIESMNCVQRSEDPGLPSPI